MREQRKRSPKSKFLIEFNYSKSIEEIGSVCSITTDKLENSENTINHYVQMARKNNANVTITVKENKKKYPEFDWVKISQITKS